LDQIAAISQGPSSDPSNIFPQEIWEKFVHEAGLEEYEFDAANTVGAVTLEDILPLMLVSIRWRDSILNNPPFWSTLTLSSRIEDLEAKLYPSIILSRTTL
jgi:hypothetical protein